MVAARVGGQRVGDHGGEERGVRAEHGGERGERAGQEEEVRVQRGPGRERVRREEHGLQRVQRGGELGEPLAGLLEEFDVRGCEGRHLWLISRYLSFGVFCFCGVVGARCEKRGSGMKVEKAERFSQSQFRPLTRDYSLTLDERAFAKIRFCKVWFNYLDFTTNSLILNSNLFGYCTVGDAALASPCQTKCWAFLNATLLMPLLTHGSIL